jgi:hypothetical protein
VAAGADATGMRPRSRTAALQRMTIVRLPIMSPRMARLWRAQATAHSMRARRTTSVHSSFQPKQRLSRPPVKPLKPRTAAGGVPRRPRRRRPSAPVMAQEISLQARRLLYPSPNLHRARAIASRSSKTIPRGLRAKAGGSGDSQPIDSARVDSGSRS